MDFSTYIVDKESGRVQLIAAGGGYAIASKRWDATTGQPIAPEIVAIDQQSITDMKQSLQDQITQIDAVLADIAALQQ